VSHHKKLFLDGEEIGYVRVTNNGTILSIWIKDQKKFYLLEVSK